MKSVYRLEKGNDVQITESVDRKVALEFDGYVLVEPEEKAVQSAAESDAQQKASTKALSKHVNN